LARSDLGPGGRRGRGRLWPLLLVLALSTTGCVELDDVIAMVPIFAFMRDTPMIEPYEMPRPAPPGSVPYASPAGVLLPPIEATEEALTAFGERTPNPVPLTDEVLAAGQVAYDRHCMVCHGPAGRGDGPIIRPGVFPFANDLTLPLTVERTDGYLYAITRTGRGLMAGYGSRVNHWERWYIVHYIRHLQAAAAAEAAQRAPGGPELGAAAGDEARPGGVAQGRE
jgi:mono/diheme cytochrome c family protein